ncbi:MAG: hypothetical protein B7Y90_04685 [Alphaproteobacteria bacterium 32-64-14]|nr:MAG: hypothetical protein B7Y90_04685 [Alphaproteobacteria bacterium 32-64-14]
MADLLFEVWRDADGTSCWAVERRSDEARRKVNPEAVFVRAFAASSFQDAMQQHYGAEGWGDYDPAPGADQPFTSEQAAEQQAYLAIRPKAGG